MYLSPKIPNPIAVAIFFKGADSAHQVQGIVIADLAALRSAQANSGAVVIGAGSYGTFTQTTLANNEVRFRPLAPAAAAARTSLGADSTA